MATLQELENAKLVTIDNLSAVKTYIDNNKVQTMDFSMRIDNNGNLICDYPDGTEEPNMTINSEGFLVYTY